MEIRSVKIKEIKPYDRNAKKHDDTQINNVAESIRQFGFVQPIVIDSNGVIVIGHCRFEAAKRLKYAEVPCIMVDDLTPEQVDALRIVDNKTNESPWDIDLLTEELQDLDLSMFDFAWDLMEETAEAAEITEDEAPEVDKTNDPISKFGQIWKLGRHRLMCGDSTSEENVKALLGGAKADLLLTDPPYGVDYTGGTKDALKIQNDAKTDEEMIEFLSSAFRSADSVMKPGAVFYIWYAGLKEYAFDKACQSSLTGLNYARNLFFCALLCYYDRFHNFDVMAVTKLFTWAMMIRVDMTHLGFDTINRYAIGRNDFDRYSNAKPVISMIAYARRHTEIAGMRLTLSVDDRANDEWKELYSNLCILNGYSI